MSSYNYSSTASSNTSLDGVGVAGSDSPQNADNALREIASNLRDDWVNGWGGATVGGTGNAITITLSGATVSSAFSGMMVGFIAGADNTSTATLNVSSIGAEPLKKALATTGAETALASGDIQSGGLYLAVWRSTWDSTNGAWQLVDLNRFVTELSDDTSPALGGTLAGGDNTVSRVNLLDYGEVTNAIGSVGGGSQTIDLESGNVVTATVDTSETTFTFSNPTASDEGCSFTLVLTNGGSQTVNWPASVDWAGGTAPTLTSSGVDILVFMTVDGGTTWYGFSAGLDMS